MRVLLVPIGSAGDVHPFIGIGLGLKARGHDVWILTNGYFESLVRRVGLNFGEIGTADEYLTQIANPQLWHPRKGFGIVARNAIVPLFRIVYDAIAERNVPGETIVAAATLGLGARLAQEKLGIPTASVHVQPLVFRSAIAPPILPRGSSMKRFPRWLTRTVFWIADKLAIDPILVPELDAFRRELGLPPVRRVMDRWMHSPDCVLGLFPAWFCPPQPDWPANVHLTGFPLYDERDAEPLSAELEEFLDSGEPPIAFTPGSAMVNGAEFFATAAAACERIGRRGILLTRHRKQVPETLPPFVRHIDFAPFGQLLPRVAAVVHHAGIGSSSQAMAAGTPQLIYGLGAFDQPDNTDRMVRLGVAKNLPLRRFSVASLSSALQQVQSDSAMHESCRAVASRFRGVDPIGAACNALEGLALQRGVLRPAAAM